MAPKTRLEKAEQVGTIPTPRKVASPRKPKPPTLDAATVEKRNAADAKKRPQATHVVKEGRVLTRKPKVEPVPEPIKVGRMSFFNEPRKNRGKKAVVKDA